MVVALVHFFLEVCVGECSEQLSVCYLRRCVSSFLSLARHFLSQIVSEMFAQRLVEAGLVRKKAAWYTYGEGKKEIKFQAKDFRKVLDDMGDAAKPLIDKALEGV